MAGGRHHGEGVLMERKVHRIICWVVSATILCGFGLVSSTTFPGDVTALQAIQNSLVDTSNRLSSWGGGDPCDDGWVGVYCVASDPASDYPNNLNRNFTYVTELRLLRLNLEGSLATEIGSLPALKYLNFMWNQISGSVPTTIGQLKNLRFLLLSGNRLTGGLPRELGFLPYLTRMQLDGNNLSGPIPDTFIEPNLGRVEYIQLNNNSLDGSIPVGLANLTSLQYLFLDSNNFTGTLPMGVGSNANLVTVQLDNNNFDSIPQEFGTMPNLVKLSLSNCNLTGGIPSFSLSSSLAVVDLSHNVLTGSMTNATLSPNLTTLDLSYNNLSGSVPYSVGSLLSLQILELRDNQISGMIPSNVGESGQQRSTIFDFQDNLINSVGNSTNLLTLKSPGGNSSFWLSGNPFCSTTASQENNPLCVRRDIDDFLNEGGVPPRPPSSSHEGGVPPRPSSSSQGNCPAACSAPYVLTTVSQSNNCQCAIPITVQLQLVSPSFPLFGPYVQQFTTYLASGLNVETDKVQVQSYVYQPGTKFLLTILLFPAAAQFDDSDVAAIYTVFANWGIPSSALFGPYDLISFSVPEKISRKSTGLSGGAIAGIASGVLAFVVLKTLCMYYVLRYWLLWRSRGENEKKQGLTKMVTTFKSRRSFSSIKVASVKEFTFEEIAKATDNFSNDRLVGEGGYGKVYSGTLEDGQKVAVKRAMASSYQGSQEFETEIQLLSRVHHKNLVSLIGYSNDQGEQVLVYEFIAYGSLLWHLSPAARVPLTFLTRLQIALDSARGIHYLHTQADPPIYHRDVKASNILLDEKFHAKVSDFGLSKLAPQPDLAGMVGYVSTVVKGTPGYLDPEYFKTHRLTDKSDVYSFGVVLLVLMTGMQPIAEGKNLVREVNSAYDGGLLAKVVDVRIRGSYCRRAMETITRLALVCCRDSPDERPTISEVVTQLEELWKETYYATDDGNFTADAYSGDLRNDIPKSEDSFFEIDPSKDSSISSAAWSSHGNPDSGSGCNNNSNKDPGSINIVNPR